MAAEPKHEPPNRLMRGLSTLARIIGRSEDPKFPPRPKDVKGKADEIVEKIVKSDPVVKLSQKGVETPLRSFHQGGCICMNLGQAQQVYYYDSDQPENPWTLTSPSQVGSLVRNEHFEAMKAWIGKLDPLVIEFIKIATQRRGILVEHLSRMGGPSSSGQAIEEYVKFHDFFKKSFNSTDADELKLALGPDRDLAAPRVVRLFRNSSHIEDARSAGVDTAKAAPPSMVVNLSFQTYYYISVFSDKIKNTAIDRVATQNEMTARLYEERVRAALTRFISSKERWHQWLKQLSESQGALIVALPEHAEFRPIALSLLNQAVLKSGVAGNKIRTVYFFTKEDAAVLRAA